MWRSFAILLLAFGFSGVATTARSQAPPKAATAEEFPELAQQWDALNSKLKDVNDKYDKAFTSQVRRKIYDEEYKPLVKESETLLPRLREAAEAAYAARPDEKSGELLLGFANRDLKADRFEPALQTAQQLLDGKLKSPAVHLVLGSAAYAVGKWDLAQQQLVLASEHQLLSKFELDATLKDIAHLKAEWEKEEKLRTQEAAQDDLPRVVLKTTQGDIVVELFENEAPQTVGNFVSLVRDKFYDGIVFHRVLPGFMAQGGCPEGTGLGGPGYEIYDEHNQEGRRAHFRGSLSMANTGAPNSGGSQFFLNFKPTPHLDGKHTVFGRVIEGVEVLAKLRRREPGRDAAPPDKIVTAEVLRAREHEYAPAKVSSEKPESDAKPEEPKK